MATPKLSPTKVLLADRIQKNRRRLWDWHLEHARRNPPPFYSSVDLRDSGHKVVPVDSNLYPAGFNNICPADLQSAPPVFRANADALASRLGRDAPKRVLILQESNTKNTFYTENLHYLRQIFRDADYETELGWYGPLPEGATDVVKLTSATGKELLSSPITIENGVLRAGQFVPDMILLNNDFSGGYPKPLDEVTQAIVPSHTLGWHSRKKSEHFTHYNQLAHEFADILEVDPWLLQIDTEAVGPVNFNEELGVSEVATAVDRILKRTQAAYDQHKIKDKPFVFVKNNSGTYGMGIMVVHSADEVLNMNRRTKNKMSVGKNRAPIASVAVQEGVPTATLVQRLAAEPVIYLVGSELIGGFLRTNPEKGIEDNLNSQGMVFRKLCMSDLKRPEEIPDLVEHEGQAGEGDEPVLELVYGSIARISALATGIELAQHGRKA